MTIKKGLTNPSKTPESVQIRDSFETPRYATELLLPFIPDYITSVWECAAGGGRIAQVLYENKLNVVTSDIKQFPPERNTISNFLTDEPPYPVKNWLLSVERFAIITNPPFSVKREFIEKAFEYGVPFAFLINADYSGEQISWIQRGCEKIIPTRRINYLTPNILRRIHEGEIYTIVKRDLLIPETKMEYFVNNNPEIWNEYLLRYIALHNYQTLDAVPQDLLHKYSSSQFHSMWLTYGFGIGRTETFVDLPIQWIKERIV